MKKIWIIAGAAVLGGLGLWYFLRGDASGQEAGKYKTAVVDRGDVAMTVTATGTISAVTTVQVGSQVSGIIAALYADFNTPVTKGQLIAELDPTTFEATVAQRRADVAQSEVRLRNARAQLQRQEQLLAKQLVAAADYDLAKADFDALEAQISQVKAALLQAQTNLGYTKIRSPIDGVVVDRQYDIGQTVAASFQAPTLFTIAQDLTKMQVQADVDQSDIGRIRVGQSARFTVDAYPEEEFVGAITQVRLNATVNQNVVTYPVIVGVENGELKLRPKMTADLSVEVDRVKDVLRVPNAALRFRPAGEATSGAANASNPAAGQAAPGGSFAGAAQGLAAGRRGGEGGKAEKGWQTVYRLAAGGKLQPVQLRTGLSDGKFSEVLEGELAAGENIVVGLATTKAGAAPASSPLGQSGPGGRRF
ncbi:MAG: efflux RND transporter periplasmic adaptor subunit [Thermoanaerobaculia bacterium]|nr:efflux RND transporter periplasmic adaptor subunit [Thermoanaerobaculia bacterium]